MTQQKEKAQPVARLGFPQVMFSSLDGKESEYL